MKKVSGGGGIVALSGWQYSANVERLAKVLSPCAMISSRDVLLFDAPEGPLK